jgi:uncharacterized protein
MDAINFIDLTLTTVILLFVVGFVGGMVSGFIGSGGAFVMTPAMMSLGVPGIIAVASNMAHKFPKALVGSIKRAKYGQVDVKLGLLLGVFAEAGVFAGKEIMTGIRRAFGDTGTDLYVSIVFVLVLAIVGGIVLRDALRMMRNKRTTPEELPRLARWARSIRIPGTMMYFKSIDAEVSWLIVAPLGFATGLLAASIAVGGFVGVPAMIYILGVPAIMASATELVVAFVMGLGGSLMYAWEGFVDIRLAMIILAGSLFGLQIGAIGTTYVKEHSVKFVMGLIMVIVLFSRLFKLPIYLSDLGLMAPVTPALRSGLDVLSTGTLAAALLVGASAIVYALVQGISEHRRQHAVLVDSAATD